MNKALLALKLAEQLDIPKKLAEDFVAAFQEIVTESLAHDEEVTIAGFGTFSSRIRAARKGVNPRNPSEVIDVPAVKVPKFKAGKALKDALKAATPGYPVKEAPAPVAATEPDEPAPEPSVDATEDLIETPAEAAPSAPTPSVEPDPVVHEDTEAPSSEV